MKIWGIAALLTFSMSIFAFPVNKIVVFGDSLSDNGNLYEYMKHQLPISPPYYQGRFSNGPVWIELVTSYFYPDNPEEHILDYAFGGSGISEDASDDDDALLTLGHEIDSYLLAHGDRADQNSLFVMWVGSNNYIALPEDPEDSLRVVNEGIRKELERLVSKGAKHFLVLNLPDLGRTPAATEFDSTTFLSDLASRHNVLVEKTVENLKQVYPDLDWIFFSVNEIFMNALNYPEEYGFTNTTETCYEAAMDDEPSSKSMISIASSVKFRDNPHACDGYLFFDPIHPTALAHRYIMEECVITLKKAGVEFK